MTIKIFNNILNYTKNNNNIPNKAYKYGNSPLESKIKSKQKKKEKKPTPLLFWP